MIIFDTETTGLVGADALPLAKQPKIIEFAAVKLDDKTLKEKAQLEFMVHPGHPLPDDVIKITGIKDDDLKDKPPFQAYFKQLCEFFIGETTVVAHNCTFDMSMMELDLRRLGKQFQFPWPSERKCTVELTNHIKGHRLKLAELYEHATNGGKFSGAHRAINDVKALATIVRWMRKENLI